MAYFTRQIPLGAGTFSVLGQVPRLKNHFFPRLTVGKKVLINQRREMGSLYSGNISKDKRKYPELKVCLGKQNVSMAVAGTLVTETFLEK